MARYEAGETLASIARTYDCSPPAISYIVSRSRVRHPAPEPAAPASEVFLRQPPQAQLMKGHAAETGGADAAAPGKSVPASPPHAVEPARPALSPPAVAVSRGPAAPTPAPAEPAAAFGRVPARPGDSQQINGNEFGARPGAGERDTPADWQPRADPARPAAAPPAGGSAAVEQRRTLHLSLGDGGSSPPGNPRAETSGPAEPVRPQMPLAQRYGGAERFGAPANPARAGEPQAGGPERPTAHPPAVPGRSAADAAPRREGGGSFIDRELRARVDGDISAFLEAFDAALAADTPESRSALREATDRLLRAGARTRIELERLEARVPLPAREASQRSEPAWRYR